MININNLLNHTIGSTSAFTVTILRKHGYKSGLFMWLPTTDDIAWRKGGIFKNNTIGFTCDNQIRAKELSDICSFN